ncbi:MAG: amidohydrolase family protein [Acidobacteriota bacterium]|nr:amidohydrolase family protein [Acidobacteriota bacterium]
MRFRLEAGNATCVVADGKLWAPEEKADLTVNLGDAALMPGLVNAHDHLHRNHLPRIGEPPYTSAALWGADLHARFADDLARRHMLPLGDALLFGAFKNVLGGVTSVVHHDRWEPDFASGFPVNVARLPTLDGLRNLRDARDGTTPPATGPWAMHLAEGTSDSSSEEIEEAFSLGLLSPRLLAVHLVAARPSGIARLAAAGCAAVWCPTSNLFLYGATAPRALFEAELDVLLGTDALVSGSGTLLHEIGWARTLGFLSDARLVSAVTDTAARRLGLSPPSLDAGAPADVVALSAPLLEALPRDVALVVVGGRPVLADERHAPLFETAGIPSRELTVGGVPKRVAAPLVDAALLAFHLVKDLRRIIE